MDKVYIGKLLSFSQSPLPTKIQKPFTKTYRVQGLPLTVNAAKLQGILQNQYRLEDPSTQEIIRVGSLAEAPDGRTLVATVSFFQEPLVLLKNRRDDFKLTDSVNQVPLAKPYNLTIDDEFVGLTTLHCPKKEDHKVEYVTHLKSILQQTFLTTESVSLLSQGWVGMLSALSKSEEDIICGYVIPFPTILEALGSLSMGMILVWWAVRVFRNWMISQPHSGTIFEEYIGIQNFLNPSFSLHTA